MLNLQDFQCIHNQGILQKYARKSDGAIFSVKSLIASNQFKPEHHPVIQTLEKLSQHSHPNLPRYFGYTATKTEEFTDILVFFEESEGALFDYLKEKSLSKAEISALANELIEVMIFIDRNAYALPAYITPYNILVSRDPSGKIRFKPFAIIPHDENRKVSDEDLKFAAPELYEKNRLKRLHLTINAEKAMFYSIGILVLYCSTNYENITDGRDRIDAAHFTTQNQARETEAVTMGKAKALSLNNTDNQMNALLDKLLVYSDKERADFRIWQHVLKDASGGKRGANPVKSGKKEKYVNNAGGGAGASGSGSGSGGKNKNSCKSACCSMF